LVIDVDVALLLQQALAVSLGLGENATIFEICAAIDAQGLNITAVIDLLEIELDAVVDAQITLLITQIIEALEDILGFEISAELVALIIAAVDIDAIVDDIIADVEVSLGILQACLGLDSTGGGGGLVPLQIPTVQQMNPTIQQNSQVFW
jgi:hypothetical protein